jgi:hypothetical protein
VGLQQVLGEAKGFLAIFKTLPQFQHVKRRKLFGEHLTESHFAFLVAAIANRAGKKRHFSSRPLAQKPPQRKTGQPTGLPIVDADEGPARRIRNVGRERHDRYASDIQRTDGLTDRWMVERDNGHGIGSIGGAHQSLGQRPRIQSGAAHDHNVTQRFRRSLFLRLPRQFANIGVGALRQMQFDPHGLGRPIIRRQITKLPRRCHHLGPRACRYARAGVHHPVHSGRRDVRRLGDVAQRRAQSAISYSIMMM